MSYKTSKMVDKYGWDDFLKLKIKFCIRFHILIRHVKNDIFFEWYILFIFIVA